MAAPQSSNLLDRVRFERRSIQPNDAGNVQGDWETIGRQIIRAQVNEIIPSSPRTAELVDAAKLQGTSHCLVVVRSSAFSRSITTDDRLVVVTAERERVLNIRYRYPPARGNFVTFLCQDGIAA